MLNNNVSTMILDNLLLDIMIIKYKTLIFNALQL